MSKGFYQMPYPENELVRNYEPNSKELENHYLYLHVVFLFYHFW